MITGAVVAGMTIKNHVANQVPEQESYLIFDQVDAQQQQFIDELKQNREEAVFEAQKKVIQIETPIGSIGSGFLYNQNGDFVTNAHVVANANEVTVITAEANQYTGKVIGISKTEDIALVRVEELAGREPLEIEYENKAALLDPVLALGSPLGFQNTVTVGEVNAIDRSFTIAPFLYNNVTQITAPISPGNSGGPLLHAETMKVIGINSAEEPEKNLGYSIPINDVVPQLEEWVNTPMETLPEFEQYAEQTTEVEVPSPEEQALYLVQYYYSSLQFNDFVTAYSLMGGTYKEENSYEDFRELFRNMLSLSLEATETLNVADEVEVRATIEMEEFVDGESLNQTYVYRFLIGYENDQLKIKQMSRR